MLNVLDEYTRQTLCVEVRDNMGSDDVLKVMHRLLMKHGKPEFIRSDNGGEFVAQHLQDWLRKVGVWPIKIYPVSPCDLPPEAPSFITRVCGCGFHIPCFRFGQARCARSLQIAQALDALQRVFGSPVMSAV